MENFLFRRIYPADVDNLRFARFEILYNVYTDSSNFIYKYLNPNNDFFFKSWLRQLCDQLFPIQYPDSWYDFVTSGHLRTVAIFHEDVMIAVIICELKKRFQASEQFNL